MLGYGDELYLRIRVRSQGMMTAVLTPFVCGILHKGIFKRPGKQIFFSRHGSFLAGGTGHPYFSTDTTTVLRAVEIEAETILLAKAMRTVSL